MPARLTAAAKAAQAARVIQLRRGRLTWDQIAKEMTLSVSHVHGIYQRALAENPITITQVDEHRVEETELIDAAVRNLLTIALDRSVSPRTRVEAWSGIRGWAERKAKLLGLDAPAQVQVTTIDALDAQIATLEVELAGNPSGAPAAVLARLGGMPVLEASTMGEG